MTAHEAPPLARRVITGVDEAGRSIISQDDDVSTWIRRPTGSLIMDVWRIDELPTTFAQEPDAADELVLLPSRGGVCVRLAVFPPDSDIDPDAKAAYEASLASIYGEQGDGASSQVPGMHRTETVDVVTVVDGEIWMVMDEGETCLRAGDTLVQRGTRHAWQNRSDRPCTLSTVMLPVTDVT
jgi:mannose-6-phosphate isomerase-like protein (cupin superfamily)